MIKVANNLQKLVFAKIAETEVERAERALAEAKRKDRKNKEKDEIPNDERRVDYSGRARRGGIAGALLGAIPGALVGAGLGSDMIDRGDWKDTVYSEPGSPFRVIEPGGRIPGTGDSTAMQIAKILAGVGVGGIGGALLGGGAGALGNMGIGFISDDIIKRDPQPNRLRRGVLGGLLGGSYGALAGGLSGAASNFTGEGSDFSGLVGGGLGLLGGGALGALSGAYLGPWLSKDLYSQKYMHEDKK